MDQLLKQQISKLTDQPVKWNCPLSEYTSFCIGGPAEAIVSVQRETELQLLMRLLHQKNVLWRVIGRGTNLLVHDSGYKGVVILLDGDFKKIEIVEEATDIIVSAGAGMGLAKLSVLCAERGFSGLEFAAGIPGTVGGAAVMNAGAWGGEISDVLESLQVMSCDGAETLEREELKFNYRKIDNFRSADWIVTAVRLKLKSKSKDSIRQTCDSYRRKRRERQPQGYANAGSIFKNPDGDSAGRLIEASGLKGKTVGDALVSEKHANFIVNRGNATFEDVLGLIKYVQNKVREDSGVFLEPEVHIL